MSLTDARAGLLVDLEDDQAQGHLQRRGIGHVALHAFLDVVLRLLELVVHELEHRGLVEVLDREDRLEDALQPLAVLGHRPVAGVQEQVVAGLLNLDEVRHLRHFADLAVELANALVTGMRLSHARNLLLCSEPPGGEREARLCRTRRSHACATSHVAHPDRTCVCREAQAARPEDDALRDARRLDPRGRGSSPVR